MKKILFYISILFVFNACKQPVAVLPEIDGVLLAEVEDKQFYLADIPKIQFNGKTSADSLAILNNIVDEWIEDEIFSLNAIEKIKNFEEINFEVENYRNSLISAAYEKELIANFDLNVSQEELEYYYNEHLDYFVFEESHYNINYVLLPRITKNIAQIKKSISKGTANQWLNNYCANTPSRCVLKYSAVKSQEFLRNNLKIPSSELRKKNDFSYQYVSTKLVLIYKINRIYRKGQVAPMNLVKSELTSLALHKKKQEYLKEIKEKTIQKAKNDKIFEKYIN